MHPAQLEWKANGHRRRLAVARQKRASRVCYLCGLPIDLSLPRVHPLAFQLDHKTPLNAGGDPWNPRNHGSTHRKCNRAKSDGPVDGTRLVPTSRHWL